MDLEKYTERARGVVQTAQTLALREGHQQLTPLHLLKVLLDDPDGLMAERERQFRQGVVRLHKEVGVAKPTGLGAYQHFARSWGGLGRFFDLDGASRLMNSCSFHKGPTVPKTTDESRSSWYIVKRV